MSVTWPQIRESLQLFDRTAILQTLQQFLDAELEFPVVKYDNRHRELPRAKPELYPFVKKLHALLARLTGAWYGEDRLMVGDEILSSWCWCHSFLASLSAPKRSQQIREGATAILEQLEQLRNFMLKLTELFDSMPLSADLNQQEAQMQSATIAIVNFIILETQCNESWYRYASTAIAWFLESKEVSVSEILRSHIDQTVEISFTSWTTPPTQTKRIVSETIAFELLRQEFDRQYPPQISP